MKIADDNILSLGSFEGPIEFLLHLVQMNEIDLSEIALREITAHYMRRMENMALDIDASAEFIGTTASLLLLKSKRLLPKHEQTEEFQDVGLDPRFDIIHQLIDYCRFKDAAKSLRDREDELGAFYPRGSQEAPEVKRGLGLDHLSISDLASLFQQVLAKAESYKGVIQEEIWSVADKMVLLRRMVAELKQIQFEAVFPVSQCKEELITMFLAVLELMKQGEVCILRDRETAMVMIAAKR